ncbi:hypothetical protein Mlab_1194 [Methanocorpusculum labreanum Z]|uniref:Uncharacterized protein n=1 Tax=Methanocorpusculum labreanum (strain ATCC 43576 / DSM 4855 / Z) TaxID=410358 RepID=A2SSQ7_METLZ|nr:hypothetical protein [Methanocorpusculum labreanum]ABN07363.1 hypothetical protein Mlab_1194 [Methanocorpusculum labreanum Z]
MTADFIQTAVSKSSKRTFTAEFTNAAAYDAIVAEITGETNPLGLAEVELGKETYKTYVGYFDPNTSEMNGKVQVTAFSRAEYTAAVTALTGSADLKTAFGNGGTAETSEIGTEATWNVRISAKLGTDTFQISFNRDSMIVSGYADDATLAAVETWADTMPGLC